MPTNQRKLLYRCKSIFPFDFFPTVIEVDDQKVTIIYGLFFFSKQVISILIEDLVNIEVTTGLFFSSVQFDIRYFESNPEKIKFLSRKAGTDLREIITGLIQMNSNDALNPEDMSKKKVLSHTKEMTQTREPV